MRARHARSAASRRSFAAGSSSGPLRGHGPRARGGAGRARAQLLLFLAQALALAGVRRLVLALAPLELVDATVEGEQLEAASSSRPRASSLMPRARRSSPGIWATGQRCDRYRISERSSADLVGARPARRRAGRRSARRSRGDRRRAACPRRAGTTTRGPPAARTALAPAAAPARDHAHRHPAPPRRPRARAAPGLALHRQHAQLAQLDLGGRALGVVELRRPAARAGRRRAGSAGHPGGERRRRRRRRGREQQEGARAGRAARAEGRERAAQEIRQ